MPIRFLLSTLSEFPNIKDSRGNFLLEVAIAGKSNVGKSSLINHLFKQKKIAKISSKPGKTQFLNFFLFDENFLVVDLPGYGFAKAPKKDIKNWSLAIDTYLNQRENLALILLLIDSRRLFSKEDEALICWAEYKKIPLLLVFTKTDKLSQSERQKLMNTYRQAVCYSITDSHCRDLLKKRIGQYL